MNKFVSTMAFLTLLALGSTAVTQTGNSSTTHLTAGTSAAPDRPLTVSAGGGNASQPQEFVIGTGDVLAISVWKNADVSRVVPVRTDGRISLPLIGELQAGGRTAKELEKEITDKLKEYIAEPEVSVIIQEIKSQKFNVLGMVMHPGSFPLAKPVTVVDAIASAGGFRDFAKQRDVYILRRDPSGKTTRLPFNYKNVIKGRNAEQNIELEPNDTVVVP
jgi:polysaccharide export outer membrane protein